jgi:hypothetical protein
MTAFLEHAVYALLAFDVVVLLAAVGSAMWINRRDARRNEASLAAYHAEQEREAAGSKAA